MILPTTHTLITTKNKYANLDCTEIYVRKKLMAVTINFMERHRVLVMLAGLMSC